MKHLVRHTWFLFCVAWLAGFGCSSFNRDWKKAAVTSTPASGLNGRWEGTWRSAVNGHNGKLRALITETGPGKYSARFHAKYQKILSFGYTVPLQVAQTDSGFTFRGEADLGSLAGGLYRYEGHADDTNFTSTYSCKYDHGHFQMRRP
jgi:hypothetical protein